MTNIGFLYIKYKISVYFYVYFGALLPQKKQETFREENNLLIDALSLHLLAWGETQYDFKVFKGLEVLKD